MISATFRHLNWMSRLATSRKLPYKIQRGSDASTLLLLFSSVCRKRLWYGDKDSENFEHQKSNYCSLSYIQRPSCGQSVSIRYWEHYFEVVFKTSCFMHLTGVNSSLSAKDFYKKSTDTVITTGQFYFDNDHSYSNAKKKLPCLMMLPNLTSSLVCVVKDMKTVTLTYKIGLTNLDFTIGLTENLDLAGNKINDWFIPRTLRVRDKAIEDSTQAEFVDFIFEKDASSEKYGSVSFMEHGKNVPSSIKPMLTDGLLNALRTES